MLEVAIYDSVDLNTFATGINRNNALVAVSTGLLQAMEPEEVEAVLAHEISYNDFDSRSNNFCSCFGKGIGPIN